MEKTYIINYIKINVPDYMKEKDNWVLWRRENNKKTPYNANTGKRANITVKEEWCSFEHAIATLVLGDYDGIGFALDGDMVVIDADNCIDSDGNIHPEIQRVLDLTESYAEYSPSGNGIHIFILKKSEIQIEHHRAELAPVNGFDKAHIEMYDNKRYITFTGEILDYNEELIQDDYAIKKIYSTYICKKKQEKSINDDLCGDSSEPEIGKGAFTVRLRTNEEVIAAIKRSVRKEEFMRLYYAENVKGFYESESEADMSLCGILSFFTCKNKKQMDEIFRGSKRYNDRDGKYPCPKWDVKKGQFTYGERTMNEAIKNTDKVYNPESFKKQQNNQNALRPFEQTKMLTPEKYIQSKFVPADLANYLSDNMRYHESGDGDLFANIFQSIIKYCTDKKAWYVYGGTKWNADAEGLSVIQLLVSLAYYAQPLFRTNQPEYSQLQKWLATNYQKKILEQSKRTLHDTSSIFDDNPNLFNCKNGTIDLSTMEFHQHCSEDMLSLTSNVVYAPSATCERFNKFLNEIFMGNESLIDYVQRVVGYSLCGNPKEEKFFILYGKTTRNGKTTFVETLSHMFGDYARTMRVESLMATNSVSSSSHTEDLANLSKARFVSCSETKYGVSFDTAQLKRLTGRNTISVRGIYESESILRPMFCLFIDTNHLPYIYDCTVFDSNRVSIIPFEVHIPAEKQDVNLKDIFRQPENVSGIFNWCLEGVKKYQQHGLHEPQIITDAINAYKTSVVKCAELNCGSKIYDDVADFVNTALCKAPDNALPTPEMYDRYTAFCYSKNITPKSNQGFVSRIKDFGEVKKKARKSDGQSINHIFGFDYLIP